MIAGMIANLIRTLTFLSATILLTAQAGVGFSDQNPGLHAKLIPLDSRGFKEILPGPPASVRLQSGYVVLAPGESVGKHSTGHHEELLIVLQGDGVMTFEDGTSLPVKENSALYCPPQTGHNITNTGRDVLRYVYVVADTQ